MKGTTQSLDDLNFSNFKNINPNKFGTTGTPYQTEETFSQMQTQNTSFLNKRNSDNKNNHASLFGHTEVISTNSGIVEKAQQLQKQPNRANKIISEKLIDDIIAKRASLISKYEHSNQDQIKMLGTNVQDGHIQSYQENQPSILYGELNNNTSTKKKKRQDPGRYSFAHSTIIEEDPDELYERQVSDYSQKVQRFQNKLSRSLVDKVSSHQELQTQIDILQKELNAIQSSVASQHASQFVPYHYNTVEKPQRIVQDNISPKHMAIGLQSETMAETDQRKLLSIEYPNTRSEALMPFLEDPSQHKISKKQESNLKKLFKFYSTQHSTQEISKLSFDELRQVSNQLTKGDFLKLCNDFKMPISQDDLVEIFRQKAVRADTKFKYRIDFEGFLDVLKEIFYVKQTQQEIFARQKEIKILGESNLTWSIDQKQEVVEQIKQLQSGKRDISRDHIYLSLAHEHLRTHDLKYIQEHLKSVNMPFKSRVQKGQKFDSQSYQPYDHNVKGRFVKEPKTGISIVQNYETVTQNYFDTRYQRDFESHIKAQILSNQSFQTIQHNRQKYQKLKNAEVFQPQGLERDSIEQFKKAKKDREVKKHLRQRELHPEKFDKPKYGQSWQCLGKLEYPASEQREITQMIGLKYDPLPVKGKEGKGGGGQPHHRRQQTLEKVGSSQAFKDIQMTLDFGQNKDAKPINKINYLRQSYSKDSSLEKASSKKDKNTIYMKSTSNLISTRKNQSSPDYTDYQFQVPNIKVKKSLSNPPESHEQISVASTNLHSAQNQTMSLLQNQTQTSKANSSTTLSMFHQPQTLTTFKRGYNPSKFSVSGQFKIQDPDIALKRKQLVIMIKNSEQIERVKRMNEQQELRKQNKVYWESRNKSITQLSSLNNSYDASSTPFNIYGIESKEAHSTKIQNDQNLSNQARTDKQSRLSQDLISISQSNHHSFYTNTFNQRL